MNYFKILSKGLLKENPVLVMLLGMCPTLAVTNLASTGLGMGLATTFVLICSNLVISLIKGIIPKSVRLPAFIVVIAGFVTLVSFLLEVYIPSLYDELGVFLSLIVVNCIILGRAEMFASKNGPIASVFDGIGMGLGFTAALVAVGSIREMLGSGSFFGMGFGDWFEPMIFFITPAGGFFVFGVLIAVVNIIINATSHKTKMVPKAQIGCAGCPMKDSCEKVDEGGCDK